MGKIQYQNLISVDDLVKVAPAFRPGTIRDWLFHRDKNSLSMAVVKIDGSIWLDIDRFNIWLSLDKDEVSDFRNLRTCEQILENSFLKPAKLNAWLGQRKYNGLDTAVIKKGEKRLYIDVVKFDLWLKDQNQNIEFGVLCHN
jgi:hypothetical protein